jgi:tRNA dimethylallyltransferase
VSEQLPVIVVAGPTASGKSALALDAAAAFGGTIINADSMQIYRELAILTARPGAQETGQAPHRLYGVLSAAVSCSAGMWLGMAAGEVEAARAAKRLPIVVGGTGLYLKALLEGLAPVPAIPEGARAEAYALLAELGEADFRCRLRTIDPESAAKIAAGDRQRLIRAYEVAVATGRPLPCWQREQPGGPAVAGPFVVIALLPERGALYPAIDARFVRMVEEGAIEEVAQLLRLGLDAQVPAMKAVGVRDLAAYVRGETTLAEAVRGGQKASRNYAKRQLTWLRHQIVPDLVVPEQYSERCQERICTFIKDCGLTARL